MDCITTAYAVIPQLTSCKRASKTDFQLQKVNQDIIWTNVVTFLFFHKSRGCLCILALILNHGRWQELKIWRNIHRWNKLHFFFWCLRCFILNTRHQYYCLVLLTQGYGQWLQNPSSTHPNIRLLFSDIIKIIHS